MPELHKTLASQSAEVSRPVHDTDFSTTCTQVPAAALLEAPSEMDATVVLVCVAVVKISHEQSSAG